MFLETIKVQALFLAMLIMLGLSPANAAERKAGPLVVVSIKPLHSLVAGVMKGVAEPLLIVDGNASPHTYRLKPSAARELQEADAIFWAGGNVETFLIKPLASLPRRAMVVALSQVPGIELLPMRGGERWETDHDHEHGHSAGNEELEELEELEEHEEHEGILQNIDPHVWLDPRNAKAMVQSIVQTLSDIDPRHARQYRKNGQQIEARLEKLDRRLGAELEAVSGQPYMVFHDAYQYLENRYYLNAVGSVVFQMDQASSAKRLRRLHQMIKNDGISCVFSEPEFSTKKINALIDGTDIKTAALDPLGSAFPPGPDLYFSMMTELARTIRSCLSD